ncbi:hypothetical protein Tco_0769935 [Tanacetum coccineum]|uniref:Uncharacterized protein n=1 Tax=Tanacetum coccineum TaxID=301880 RepID=A0ABQ4ZAS3_9ASTR
MNTTQAQHKAIDDALIAPANRLEFGKCNMRLKTDIKPKEATFQVVLDAFAHSLLPCIPDYYRYLGHTRDITYLTDVNVDYLHQTWREFATVINKCLSGKKTRMDKICLSHSQILWGMFHKKKIDYVYLLWEDLLLHIENKDAKKTNKIYEDTQVYGTILPKELINQAMLESNAYKTYYAFAFGKKAPKPKYVQKKADPDTSPKQKPVQATKGTRIKSKAKVSKFDKKKQPTKKPKAKGLAVLSESKVPDEQQQKTFGTDEGIGTISGVPDVPTYESESKKESWGDSDEKDDNEDDFDDRDDNDESDDKRIESDRDEIPDPNKTNAEHNKEEEKYDDEFNIEEEEKIADEESMDEEEEDEVTKELYDDVNVNLGNKDTDMTNADQGALEQQNNIGGPTQSSSVSSDFTSKLLNLDNPSPADNENAYLMDTTAQHATTIPEIISSFTTTIPPPPSFFNPLSQQATPIRTPTTSDTTTSLPALPDFASVFKFN